MKFDYLIVGAGLYGAVFAHEMKKAGKTCYVIDRRDHIAGNIYTEKNNGINVLYGIFIATANCRILLYLDKMTPFRISAFILPSISETSISCNDI